MSARRPAESPAGNPAGNHVGTPAPDGQKVPADFVGKAAVVTGGSSGIGRSTARLLAERGASVVVADRDETKGPEVVAVIRAAGGQAEFVPTDVTDQEQVRTMIGVAVETYGRLDVAVNCAGTPGTYAPLLDQKLEDWRTVLDVNLTSVFLCVQAEIEAMDDVGAGSIVNIASAAGLMGFAHLPSYVASKHGVIGFTKSVALEYARAGIRVNAVCPGSVHTPMLEGFTGGNEEALLGMGKMTPMGRLGTPEEIADAVVWLCSDAARYVTGHALAVDGGVLAT